MNSKLNNVISILLGFALVAVFYGILYQFMY